LVETGDTVSHTDESEERLHLQHLLSPTQPLPQALSLFYWWKTREVASKKVVTR